LENTVKSMAKVVSRGLPGTKVRICDPRASDQVLIWIHA
jgi:hypothetical protein